MRPTVGWSAKAPTTANSGFGATPDAYGGNQGFDSPEGVSLKAKVVNLISAVRTLMRCEWGGGESAVGETLTLLAVPLIVVNAFV